MPEIDEGDILQRAFADVQYCYSPFGNDVVAARSVPTMDGYNISMMDSQSMSSASSPMSVSLSPRGEDSASNVLNVNDETFMNLSGMEMPPPHIEILDQPVDKFRFRYKSEMMGTHGCLSSASTTSRRKRQAPTAKLVNFVGQKAKIRCTLVTSDPNRRIPHAHHLVKREGSDENDAPYEIDVSAENDFTAQFHGMGIIHTAKKHIKDELVKKMRMELLEKHRSRNANIRTLNVCEETKMKMNAENAQKWMNLNSVALCFEAFVEGPNGVMKSITERVYSTSINNLKSALTGELKICRIDKYSSPADGGEEVFMLVEKVGKKNIRVKFFETDENDREIWQGYGRFSELDVHHQYAIVFRTPPYRDLNISEPKEVFIKLERPTDGDSSDPIKFTYKPTDCLMSKKRPRISDSGSSDYQKIRQVENNVNISPMPHNNDSSRSNSQELLKLIYESSKVKSDEFAKFLHAIDIDGYADTMPLNQGNDYEQMLTTDGASSSYREPSFAETLIRETMKRIRVEPARAKELFTKMFDERTTYGDTPLHSALRHGQHEIVKHILMLSASDPDLKYLVHLKNSSGKTPLHYAVLLNQPEVVDALLALGADPNECDDRDFYPLHAAVKRPEAGACVDVLLTKELKINARDEAGWTPLHLAVEAGSFHAVRSLVKAGADVNETEVSYGRTALHIAVENSHVNIVKYLVEKTKINVNQTNLGGNTALHSAVVNPSALAKEMCKILLEHGANPRIPNHIRDTAEADEKELAFSVKEEQDDDDTSHDAGQTSFDLASNKPEILSLFNEAFKGQSCIEGETITIKEEVTEEDTLTNCLDTQTRISLAVILDKSRTWQKLAKHLQCEYLLSTLDDDKSSPSLTILNYADVQGTLSMNDLQRFLTEIGETEGAAFVKKVVNKRNGT